MKKEAAILHDSVRAWITQRIGVIDAGIKISEREDLFRDVHRIHPLDVWPVEKRVGRDTAAVAEKQYVFGFRTKSQRKISKQSHVALAVRIRGGHRKPVGQQPVVIRFAEQIATQQLQCVGSALNPFHYMREHIAVLIAFVRASCM